MKIDNKHWLCLCLVKMSEENKKVKHNHSTSITDNSFEHLTKSVFSIDLNGGITEEGLTLVERNFP